MKRFLCLFLVCILIPIASFADYENVPDISGLSYLELYYLLGCVERAIWSSDEWTKAEVPAGVYTVGEHIPAGHWSIQAHTDNRILVVYGSKLDATGAQIDPDYVEFTDIVSGDMDDYSSLHQLDIILEDGHFIELHGASIFYTYTGKLLPDFKK